ncbi:MAG: hypothetical protein ACK417_01050 [Bacteroidia bacterium]
MKKFCLLILTIGLFLPELQAQALKRHRGSLELAGGLRGQVDHYWRLHEGDSVAHGRFTFRALDTTRCAAYDSRQVFIQGQYANGRLQGAWVIDDEIYRIQINNLSQFRAQTGLNGNFLKWQLNFKEGLAHGRWQITDNRITNSRMLGGRISTIANFRDGIIRGQFEYTESGQQAISIKGSFDDNGCFDGTWTLNYMVDGTPCREIRSYDRGFLLHINLKRGDQPATDLAYEDVAEQLASIRLGENEDFSEGKELFGINFENGYPAFDRRSVAQESGNRWLETAFSRLRNKTETYELQGMVAEPVVGGTRRFKFNYPAYEDSLLPVLAALSQRLELNFDSILSSGSFVLNLQNYDSLSFYYAFVKQAQERIASVQEVISAIDSGAFDYQDRDNFFLNGIIRMHQIDTIRYEYRNRSRTHMVDYGIAIDGPDSLLMQMYRSLQAINAQNKAFETYINRLFTSIQQEQLIDELDAQIIRYLDSVNIRYLGQSRLESVLKVEDVRKRVSISESQFRLYKKLVFEYGRAQVSEYARLSDRERKIEKGEELAAFYKLIYEVHPLLAEIDRMKVRLDSAYTRYTENPFFERKAETRIKINIYNKGAGILLPRMIDDIMQARTAQDLSRRISDVYMLYHRMIELSQRDDPDVNRLNDRIRRENVPERIKRLLAI